jgi:hypothetical protein
MVSKVATNKIGQPLAQPPKSRSPFPQRRQSGLERFWWDETARCRDHAGRSWARAIRDSQIGRWSRSARRAAARTSLGHPNSSALVCRASSITGGIRARSGDPGGNAGQSCGFGISPRCISSATASGGLTGAALPATGRTVPGRAGCAQPRARIDPSSRGPHRIRDDCTDFVTTPAIHLAASHHRPSAAPASIGRPIARPLTEPSPQSPRAAPPGASSFRRGTRVAGLWASTSAGSG